MQGQEAPAPVSDPPVLGRPYRRDELAARLRVIVGGQP
jgi:hypothetical protein